MVETMEIKVDVLGQMRNLRETFTDRYTFVPELIQNAQRAGANEVSFSLSDSRREIVVTNDGEVCDDLTKVFTACVSGWSAKVKVADNPFGTGFFSVMTVADTVEVRSGGKRATWDVKKMFDLGTLDVVRIEDTEFLRGFQVTLRAMHADVSYDEIRRQVRHYAKYVSPAVILSGKPCKRLNPLEKTDDEKSRPFTMKVDLPGFKGVVYPSLYGGVKTHFQSREVSTEYLGCVDGRIFIESGSLSPRAPDRSSWIRDSRYEAFSEQVKQIGRELLLRVLRTGSNQQIDEFASVIDKTLSPEDYERYLRFDLSVEDNVLLNKIRGLSDQDVEGKSLDELRYGVRRALRDGSLDDEVIARVGCAAIPPSAAEFPGAVSPVVDGAFGVTSARVLENAPEEAAIESVSKVVEDEAGAPDTVQAPCATPVALAPEATKTDHVEPAQGTIVKVAKERVRDAYERARNADKSGLKVTALKREKLVVWLRADEMVRLRARIGVAIDYGIRVVVVRNKLQEKAITRLANAKHALDLHESAEKAGDVTNKRPQSPAEARALHLLQLIEERVYGDVTGRFCICDATVTQHKLLGGKIVESKPVDPVAFIFKGRVYMIRARLDLSALPVEDPAELTQGDRVFLAQNAVTLAHEIAHLHGLMDATREHAEKTCALAETIIALAFPSKASR